MTQEREVPGPARDNNDRIAERGYESDFARLPAQEVDLIERPGGGPHGSLDTGPANLPLAVIAVGGVIAFAALGFKHVAPLAIGLLLVLVGGIWAGLRHQTLASGAGSGTTTIPDPE